jgi:DNA-binding transcriptional ArsR family regulator
VRSSSGAILDGSRNVSELVSVLGLNQTTVSRHLRFLHDKSMVFAEGSGVNVYHTLADPRIVQALDLMRGVLAGILERRQSQLQDIRAQQG